MKTLAILLGALLISFSSYSQELETLGAGVINFLLTNPTTANKTNATEAAALSTIGKLLSISASRKHDMNVADAGRSEIVFNTTSGGQATIYSDKEGNLYLLFNGEIIPISSGLVNMASGEAKIKNSTLPGYNMTELQEEYKFEEVNKWTLYYLEDGESTFPKIAEENNIAMDDINSRPRCSGCHMGRIPSHMISTPIKRIKRGRAKGWHRYATGSPFFLAFYIYLNSPVYQHAITTAFTCNWVKDFDGKGLDLDDFQGIRRSFIEGEKMMFVFGYTTETPGNWSLEVYEASTGNVVYNKDGVTEKGGRVVSFEKDGEKLEPGVYMYNFTLTADGEGNLMKSEKFEIIAEEKE